jgi:hypothetical protein
VDHRLPRSSQKNDPYPRIQARMVEHAGTEPATSAMPSCLPYLASLYNATAQEGWKRLKTAPK